MHVSGTGRARGARGYVQGPVPGRGWGPAKVTRKNKTWISKSALNQKQEGKKRTSIRQGSLAYKYNLPLTSLSQKRSLWTLGVKSLVDSEC